jgi:hypothetical protein
MHSSLLSDGLVLMLPFMSLRAGNVTTFQPNKPAETSWAPDGVSWGIVLLFTESPTVVVPMYTQTKRMLAVGASTKVRCGYKYP